MPNADDRPEIVRATCLHARGLEIASRVITPLTTPQMEGFEA